MSDESPGPGALPPLRRFLGPGIFVALLFVFLFLRLPERNAAPPGGGGAAVHEGPAFGTQFAVRWMGPAQRETVAEVVDAVVAEINSAMSTYDPESELSRWNRSPRLDEVTLSSGLAKVIEEAYRIHGDTDGAFDPSVGPLVDLWGFGPEPIIHPPDAEALSRAQERVGLSKFEFRPPRFVRKTRSDLAIDLSAIAKGFAVDEVSRRLTARGIRDHLVEIGGEVRAEGRGPKGAWRVGIERPQAGPSREVFEVLELRGGALATSGNYRNSVTVDGRTLTHIIDPRTGRPVEHGLGSVTVVHPACVTADAWATALYVLGEDEGFRYAERNGVAALFLTTTDEAVRRRATSRYRALSKAGTDPEGP